MSTLVEPDAPRLEHKRSGSQLTSPTSKKSKLSPEEKEKKEKERVVKELERSARDAERQAREAEREVKRLEREEKKRVKDEAKAREVAAQEKKERSQLRMGNFFKKADLKPPAVLATEVSDIFKPFHLRENTTIARWGLATGRDADEFDHTLGSADDRAQDIALTLRTSETKDRRRAGIHTRRCRKTLRERLLEASNTPLEDRFSDIRYKLLQFHTDVRPAYFGTMTARPNARGISKGRNPYAKDSQLNYDYDSEADWIEGEDDDAGEELGDDDDASVASKDTYGEDGDDDFVDDAEDIHPRGLRSQQGQMVPSILGILRAEDSGPVLHMKLCKLIDTPHAIDPFENYWDPAPILTVTSKTMNGIATCADSASSTAGPALKKTTSGGTSTSTFPESLLPAFKKAIQGCTLTKINLVEKLRTDFKPYKVSKKAIEDKLGEVAQRQGKSQHDVWSLKS